MRKWNKEDWARHSLLVVRGLPCTANLIRPSKKAGEKDTKEEVIIWSTFPGKGFLVSRTTGGNAFFIAEPHRLEHQAEETS